MNTKIYGAACIVFAIATISVMIYSIDHIERSAKSRRITALQREITTLQQVKEAVMGKYIPDSLKQQSRDASHNLMYVDENSNNYYAAKKQIWATEDYIKKCKPCMYVDSLLQAKKNQLEELER